jgi:hypothetical protein
MSFVLLSHQKYLPENARLRLLQVGIDRMLLSAVDITTKLIRYQCGANMKLSCDSND